MVTQSGPPVSSETWGRSTGGSLDRAAPPPSGVAAGGGDSGRLPKVSNKPSGFGAPANSAGFGALIAKLPARATNMKPVGEREVPQPKLLGISGTKTGSTISGGALAKLLKQKSLRDNQPDPSEHSINFVRSTLSKNMRPELIRTGLPGGANYYTRPRPDKPRVEMEPPKNTREDSVSKSSSGSNEGTVSGGLPEISVISEDKKPAQDVEVEDGDGKPELEQSPPGNPRGRSASYTRPWATGMGAAGAKGRRPSVGVGTKRRASKTAASPVGVSVKPTPSEYCLLSGTAEHNFYKNSGGVLGGVEKGGDDTAATPRDDEDEKTFPGEEVPVSPIKKATTMLDEWALEDDKSSTGVRSPASVKNAPSVEAGAKPKKKNQVMYLLRSPFPNRPPTVWFEYPKTSNPRETDREMRYPSSDSEMRIKRFNANVEKGVRYNCVCSSLRRAGFERTNGSNWLVSWINEIDPEMLRSTQRHQKVNHFPGSWMAMGRKDYLAARIQRMAKQHKEGFDFMSKTYSIPVDYTLAMSAHKKEPSMWILKPVADKEGNGIRVVTDLRSLPRKVPEDSQYANPWILQRYIMNPLLINKKKFDLRLYVAVTSLDPLRIYLYDEGLVRFATHDYSVSNTSDLYTHLTNFSVNKKADDYVENTDYSRDDVGGKWSLRALRKYFSDNSIDSKKVFSDISAVLVKMFIASEPDLLCKMHTHSRFKDNCYELFGIDILLDENLKPWLLEVNISCSLGSYMPLDQHIKGMLLTDLFHMVGFVPQEYLDATPDKRIRRRNPSEIKKADITAPNVLNAHDLTVLLETEEEYRRRGFFHRIYPCEEAPGAFSEYFESPRYFNILLEKFYSLPPEKRSVLLAQACSVENNGGGAKDTEKSRR